MFYQNQKMKLFRIDTGIGRYAAQGPNTTVGPASVQVCMLPAPVQYGRPLFLKQNPAALACTCLLFMLIMIFYGRSARLVFNSIS